MVSSGKNSIVLRLIKIDKAVFIRRYKKSKTVIKFDSISADDRLQWFKWIEKAKCNDIYYNPDYCKLFDKIENGKSYMFVSEDENCNFLYPFCLRNINHDRKLDYLSEYKDITTHYGYGGPFIRFDGENNCAFVKESISSLDQILADKKVIAEFCRFHPLLDNASTMKSYYNVLYSNNTVVVDLEEELDTIWKNFRRNHRIDIKKAEEHGMKVNIGNDEYSINTLCLLYNNTMEDVCANDYYKFNRNFFFETVRSLPANSIIFTAQMNGCDMGSALYLYGSRFCYAKFLGWDRDFKYLSPSKLIFWAAIKYFKKKGIKKMMLGGGCSGNDEDSLFLFKAGFSDLRYKYFLSKRIHNKKVYKQACDALCINHRNESFFPAYRSIYQRCI